MNRAAFLIYYAFFKNVMDVLADHRIDTTVANLILDVGPIFDKEASGEYELLRHIVEISKAALVRVNAELDEIKQNVEIDIVKDDENTAVIAEIERKQNELRREIHDGQATGSIVPDELGSLWSTSAGPSAPIPAGPSASTDWPPSKDGRSIRLS